jgi:molybdate transport system substrate-binding protein
VTTVDVLCTLGVRSVLIDIAKPFAEAESVEFSARYQSTIGLMQRIENGESADVAIITDVAIETLIAEGKILPDSRRDLAAAGVGLAVRTGAARPDIGTPEALKKALLAAKSITYTVTGASGIHFADIIARLGIADAVKAKAIIRDGLAGELAASGEVELAVQQISELMQVDGIDIIGPLPQALQKATVFTAGIFSAARHPREAAALIAFLSSPATAALIKARGLEPLQLHAGEGAPESRA